MPFRLGIAAAVLATAASAQDAALEHFEKKIRPVLAASCYPCHSSSVASPQGGLRLDSETGIRKGGNSGPLIDTASPEQSVLLRALRHSDKALKMPPGKPLPPEVVADFEAWVRVGAPVTAGEAKRTSAKQLWSLLPPRKSAPPSVRGTARNEIDRFVLARLESKDLALSPEADRRTLIRRAYFDLTGLPPTAEETEQFLADRSAGAYERLIDRLLASPRYGERWGRHWLDVARYADSFNDSVNAGQKYAWSYTYRDWVIQSLNEDLPYDKFVLYQIAADKAPGADPKHLAALGFLSLGREFPNSYAETVDDRIDAVTRGFLGLTVSCARCHDHKYDPIPTKDYYSLYSVLSNIRQPAELPALTKSNTASLKDALYRERLDRIAKADLEYRQRRNAEMVEFFRTQITEYLLAARDAEKLSNAEVEELVRDKQLNLHMLRRWRKYLAASRASGEPVFRAWHALAALPEKEFAARWRTAADAGHSAIRTALLEDPVSSLKDAALTYAAVLSRYGRTDPFSDESDEQLRRVMRGPESPVDVPVDEFESIYTEGDSNNLRTIRVRYNTMLSLSSYDGATARAMAVEDVPDPQPAHVFLRGNPNNPGALAPPKFLSCLGGSDEKLFTDGAGRLELARAIIDRSNPLTARVIVNRVWMHHFGAGLVRTPSDFGFRGEQPTHPELLDYLAVRFVESGWSLKALHRLILTSAAWMQSSRDNEAARKVDPENQLLWRMNRRRLDIESLRDSALQAAGRLDGAAGGVPFPLTAQPTVPRRSVYGFIERGRVPGVLNTFDFASPDQHVPMRVITTVPQQALFFLNSDFIAEQAGHIAKRTADAADPAHRVQRLYRVALGRAPEQRELDAGLGFVAAKDDAPAESAAAPAWRYGVAQYDPASERVEKFYEFTTFTGDRWQGGPVIPAPRAGIASIRAAGGEPGAEADQSAARRWVSPVTGRITIEGTLRHGQSAVPYGDGVRGRIVSSRAGEIASWSVNGSSAQTQINGVQVEPGDTIDFIVDGRIDHENDGFTWAPVIKLDAQTWSSAEDFSGPKARPLDVWARYAQVLISTNEFAFVD